MFFSHSTPSLPLMRSMSIRIVTKPFPSQTSIGKKSCTQRMFSSVLHAATCLITFELSPFSLSVKQVYLCVARRSYGCLIRNRGSAYGLYIKAFYQRTGNFHFFRRKIVDDCTDAISSKRWFELCIMHTAITL